MLSYGLIGCGEIGRLRADALRRAGLRLAAVSDVDAERARATASGAAVESRWEDLIHRSDVDAVIVSTPPWLHAGMTVAALDAGKHVICEKPLARTPTECRRMVDAARGSGRVLVTGFNYRFYPSILKARELFDAGLIGDLDHICSYTGYSATDHNHDWLHDAGKMGGGSLRDNGIHLIDTTCYFLGGFTEAAGLASSNVWNFPGCEDNGFLLLRNAKGNIASVHASWTEWLGYRFLIEIYGTRGCIRASCFPMWTQAVWSTGGSWKKKTHWFPFVHLMEHVRSYRWVVVESFVKEHAEFERAVRGEPSAAATGEDGLRAVEAAAAVGVPGEVPAQTRP